MKIYIKVSQDNIIRDVLTFPYGDYLEVEVPEIPVGIQGGWFKLENGVIVEYPELKPITKDEEIEKLKQQQTLMQQAIDDLILGGAV